MRVPLRDAERNPRIEFLFARIFGRRVHHPDQLVVVALLLVEQRRRMIGIKAPPRLEGVPVIRKVILLLWNVGQENLVPVSERSLVVFVLLSSGAGGCGYVIGSLLIARFAL